MGEGSAKVDYEKYLRSGAWKRKRKEVLEHRGRQCERCGRKGTQFNVHHLTYERLGNELLKDLEVLCLSCHGIEHGNERDWLWSGKRFSVLRAGKVFSVYDRKKLRFLFRGIKTIEVAKSLAEGADSISDEEESLIVGFTKKPSPSFKATIFVSNEEVERAKTPRGGWTKAQLSKWEVPWPPPRGWRKAITAN